MTMQFQSINDVGVVTTVKSRDVRTPLQERTLLSIGSSTTCLTDSDVEALLEEVFLDLGRKKNVLIVPPDHTRSRSRAGLITHSILNHYGAAVHDILPALGTHKPMTPQQLTEMYPGIPHSLFREHHWRTDVMKRGEISKEFVSEVTGGLYKAPYPVELNRLIVEGGHDVIFSVGQVVPHEVVGMANHAKNLLVGCGGADAINLSHFIGAVYGMERMMGRSETPVRRIFSKALEDYCGDLNIVFILTVVGPAKAGEKGDDHGLVTRGLFVGSGFQCFEEAAKLSIEVNFQLLEKQPQKTVVYLDPKHYHSTWLGNKAIYRTRMAIPDGGELIILAPGVERFGEDDDVDVLIRKYGYRTTPEILDAVSQHQDLQSNLAAAAHLIHGSSEGRFRVLYAPGSLTRDEIEGVGYEFAELGPLMERYNPALLTEGINQVGDEEIYFVRDPALTLLAHRSRFVSSPSTDADPSSWDIGLNPPMTPSPIDAPLNAIIICGPTGAGKSVTAAAIVEYLHLHNNDTSDQSFIWADGDAQHPLSNRAKMRQEISLVDEERTAWLEATHNLLTASLTSQAITVLSFPGLAPEHRRAIVTGDADLSVEDAVAAGQRIPHARLFFLEVAPTVATRRAEERSERKTHYASPKIVSNQYERMGAKEVWSDGVTVINGEQSPEEVITDILTILRPYGFYEGEINPSFIEEAVRKARVIVDVQDRRICDETDAYIASTN